MGFPAPPRKMIKAAGKFWGKIEVRLSIFSNKGPMMEQITTLNDAQLPIPALKTGYVRDTILYTLFNPILQAILVDYRWEELKSESTFNTIPFFAYDEEICSSTRFAS